ncbi:MAG: tryptophan synthase subunit alpha [Chitinophagaceae bacterium]|nr:MAG: tryptophan synthase subunit alpha [Chitinophagaceae bacterium]
MNRLESLFQRKSKNVLNVYCTAGFPKLDSTLQIMEALETNGADIIELGMPYSDPLADGPVIQASSSVALENGMTITKLFDQLRELRPQVQVPVILMGYMNPVLQFGFERFCQQAAEVGVDGLILPDLPIYEFDTEYGEIIRRFNLNFIFLITPETSEERIKKIDEVSSGFIYAVSSSSTTGSATNMTDVSAYLKRLKAMKLANPVLVGFGIKDKRTFDAACEHANGAIIGTAYIKALGEGTDVTETTKEFLGGVLN